MPQASQKSAALLLTVFVCLTAVPVCGQEFYKDVLPIFTENCIGCHATIVKMGSLDLETPEGIRTGGNKGTILVPGNSAESRLYLMVAGKTPPFMPLNGKTLALGEIETIQKWIDAGAKFGEPVAVRKAGIPDIKPKVPVKSQIGSLAYRPDGKLIALGVYKEVRLADSTGKIIGALTGHADQV